MVRPSGLILNVTSFWEPASKSRACTFSICSRTTLCWLLTWYGSHCTIVTSLSFPAAPRWLWALWKKKNSVFFNHEAQRPGSCLAESMFNKRLVNKTIQEELLVSERGRSWLSGDKLQRGQKAFWKSRELHWEKICSLSLGGFKLAQNGYLTRKLNHSSVAHLPGCTLRAPPPLKLLASSSLAHRNKPCVLIIDYSLVFVSLCHRCWMVLISL